MEAVYRIEKLVKVYPGQKRPANDNLSFEVYEGEVFGILGDNGAGKSTLVRQMVNLLKSSSGAIWLFGELIEKDSLQVPLTVGYMPQEGGALNCLRVGEALYFTAHLRGMNRAEALKERDRLLELFRLEHLRNNDNATLSGGERRLLRLALSMAGSPLVLLLDEPTNDLDPLRRNQVWDVLRSINLNSRTTIILITHDVIEADKVVQRVAIMHEGRLLGLAPPSELKHSLGDELRIEIRCVPGKCPEVPEGIFLARRGPDHWVALAKWHDAIRLLSNLDPEHITDVHVHSPTLEDVYFHYVGNA